MFHPQVPFIHHLNVARRIPFLRLHKHSQKRRKFRTTNGYQGLLQYVDYCNKFLYCRHKRLTAGLENPSRFADNLSCHLSVLSRHLDISSRENINVRIPKRLFYSVEYDFNNQINSETIHICSYSS